MTLHALLVGTTWWTVLMVNAAQGHAWRGLALATLAMALGLALLPWAVAHDPRSRSAARRQP